MLKAVKEHCQAITERKTILYDYHCPHCGNTYTLDTHEEATKFQKNHEDRCEYNTGAKRCRTCGRCYMPNPYNITCEIGKDIHSMVPCQFYEPTRPHTERQVPVLKRDMEVAKFGYVVKKGTTMEYFYGKYVIHKIPDDFRKNFGFYVNELGEWRVGEEEVVWLPESAAKNLHLKTLKGENNG